MALVIFPDSLPGKLANPLRGATERFAEKWVNGPREIPAQMPHPVRIPPAARMPFREMNHKVRAILSSGNTGTQSPNVAGMAIRFGEAPSPFGTCRIADSDSGICHLSFADSSTDGEPLDEIRRDWPGALVTTDHDHARTVAGEIFNPQAANKPARPLLVCGTPFQIAVWQALLQIPAGNTLGYGALAAMLGKPGAARATGSAVGANSIAWLIPCHRVVPAAGGIGGFRWGPARKAAMLAWEHATFC
jgi:AraC family transcriptional regulator of adaptative response/methylated-DNA-[protein]-cysteine methyltransferase